MTPPNLSCLDAPMRRVDNEPEPGDGTASSKAGSARATGAFNPTRRRPSGKSAGWRSNSNAAARSDRASTAVGRRGTARRDRAPRRARAREGSPASPPGLDAGATHTRPTLPARAGGWRAMLTQHRHRAWPRAAYRGPPGHAGAQQRSRRRCAYALPRSRSGTKSKTFCRRAARSRLVRRCLQTRVQIDQGPIPRSLSR